MRLQVQYSVQLIIGFETVFSSISSQCIVQASIKFAIYLSLVFILKTFVYKSKSTA